MQIDLYPMPPKSVADSTEKQRDVGYSLQLQIAELVQKGLDAGVVITVSTEPNEPLAMGNYDLVIEVRPLRNYVGRK